MYFWKALDNPASKHTHTHTHTHTRTHTHTHTQGLLVAFQVWLISVARPENLFIYLFIYLYTAARLNGHSRQVNAASVSLSDSKKLEYRA